MGQQSSTSMNHDGLVKEFMHIVRAGRGSDYIKAYNNLLRSLPRGTNVGELLNQLVVAPPVLEGDRRGWMGGNSHTPDTAAAANSSTEAKLRAPLLIHAMAEPHWLQVKMHYPSTVHIFPTATLTNMITYNTMMI
jgi:hypothetical protein